MYIKYELIFTQVFTPRKLNVFDLKVNMLLCSYEFRQLLLFFIPSAYRRKHKHSLFEIVDSTTCVQKYLNKKKIKNFCFFVTSIYFFVKNT